MTRSFTTILIASVAICGAALIIEPASAMPMAGDTTLDIAAQASANVEHVRFFRHRGYYRGYGYRRGYRGYGYRRGLPGHPIRRILRAL